KRIARARFAQTFRPMQRSLRVASRPLPANVVEKLVAIVAFARAPGELGRALRIGLAPLRCDVVQRVTAVLAFRKFLRPRDRRLNIVMRQLSGEKTNRALPRFYGRHCADKTLRLVR